MYTPRVKPRVFYVLTTVNHGSMHCGELSQTLGCNPTPHLRYNPQVRCHRSWVRCLSNYLRWHPCDTLTAHNLFRIPVVEVTLLFTVVISLHHWLLFPWGQHWPTILHHSILKLCWTNQSSSTHCMGCGSKCRMAWLCWRNLSDCYQIAVTIWRDSFPWHWRLPTSRSHCKRHQSVQCSPGIN